MIVKRRQTHDRGNTGATFPNLFQHVTKCVHCGGVMYFKRNSGPSDSNKYRKAFTFFRCSSRVDGLCENGKTYKYVEFESAFLDWVIEVNVDDNRSSQITEIEKRIAEHTLKLEALDAEARRIIEEYKGTRTGQRMVAEKEAKWTRLKLP
jgi:hypothetical protein